METAMLRRLPSGSAVKQRSADRNLLLQGADFLHSIIAVKKWRISAKNSIIASIATNAGG
jgi:hypothetical protein